MNPLEVTTAHADALPVWRWEIPIYLFLGGLVAGLMVIAALEERLRPERWDRRVSARSAIAALVLLSLGMLSLLGDLEYKAHVYRFYLAFRPTSPMSWGAWILVLAYPALGLWLLGSLGEGAPLRRLREWAGQHRAGILTTVAALGVAIGTYTGVLLQTLVARPLWTSGLLGPLFLASGVSGAAALLLLRPRGEGVHRALLRWDLAALGVEATLLALLVMDRLTGSAAERDAVKLLLAGPFTGAFFGLVVLAGIAAPFAIELHELRRGSRATLAAPLFVLIGGLTLRLVFVSAGQASGG